MTLNELDSYFNSFLHREDFSADVSLNGIQIENSAPDSKQITKVAFAVDACRATAEKAAELGAQLLFVHHGLFWGHCEKVTGVHYGRLSAFMQHDTALYAAHIPLDANNPYGNNYGLAARLGLINIEPFGEWRGMLIGVRGELPAPLSCGQLAEKLFPDGEKPLHVLPFGPEKIHTVGIISGGAGEDVDQAIAAGCDAYITGEVGHEQYHLAEEAGITLIAGGHYNTETVGVNLVKAKLSREKHIETVFIDLPTGL